MVASAPICRLLLSMSWTCPSWRHRQESQHADHTRRCTLSAAKRGAIMPTSLARFPARRKQQPLRRGEIMARIRSQGTNLSGVLVRRCMGWGLDLGSTRRTASNPDVFNRGRRWVVFVRMTASGTPMAAASSRRHLRPTRATGPRNSQGTLIATSAHGGSWRLWATVSL